MKQLTTAFIAAIAAGILTTPVVAHQVTFKGTVVAAEKASIKVTVVDEKTKKPSDRAFEIDKDTKILRGDKLVTLADARIQKGEKIAVTVDHDLDEGYAIVVRLDEKK